MKLGQIGSPRWWALVVVVPAALSTSGRALAEDTSELLGLLEQSVVKAASQTSEVTRDAPALSFSISADQLRQYGMHSLDEALNFLAPGVQVEHSASAGEIGVRGVLLSQDAGGHVLLLIDGHAVNEAWGASAYFDRGTGVPFELIDHIEVIIGPGSVLYGSSAMLGVINIVTKPARGFAGAHAIAESELPTSLRLGLGYGREFSILGRSLELTLQVERFDQHGPALFYPRFEAAPDAVTGSPRPYSSDSPPGLWGGRGDDALSTTSTGGYLRLRSGAFELSLRGLSYQRSHPALSGNFDDEGSFVRDRWAAFDARYRASLSALAQLSLRAYGDHYDYRQDWRSWGAADCEEGQSGGCLWRLQGASRWAGIEPRVDLDWLQDQSLVTLLGADARIKSVDQEFQYFDIQTGASPGPDGEVSRVERSLGVYLQNTFRPTPRWGVNLGARLDVDSRFGQALSPRVAVTHAPWKGGSLKLHYAEAFRAPTVWEVYYSDPRSWIAGGSDMDSERVKNLELSLEHQWRSQHVLLGAFRGWWKDLVLLEELSDEERAAAISRGDLLADTPYAVQLRNVSQIDNYGLNMEYGGAFAGGALRYGVSTTHAFARRRNVDGDKSLIPVAAPSLANARVAYAAGGHWPTLALAARYVSRRPTNDYTEDSPRFLRAQWESRLTLSGTTPVPGLSYRLSANFAFTDEGPYTMGPTPIDGVTAPLLPVDRFRVTAGVQYDLAEW